ncbi:Cupin domain protein [Mycobacteroides salmoniphilum]|nr:Cupin domain protein [Mycobacteroides salmoniphilum]
MAGMQKHSIDALIRQLFERANDGHNAADTVVGGHERVLRQIVIALREGSALGEHENPGEATIYVIQGSVRLVVGDEHWDGRAGDLIEIPDARHSLQALADSAVLLTVAKHR